MRKRLACAISCFALLLTFGLACDSASPVAPTGTVLTISASPSEIGVNGTATIRVTAVRANGTAVNPGTIIRLETTLGSIDAQAETDDNGVALATLRGDGRIGTAMVTARAGSAETATVEVRIGEVASTVTLQATPSSISDTGGSVDLLALVRDDQGQPLPGVSVNFTTQLGRLASAGAFIVTGPNGQASDRLTVTESDIDALPRSSTDFMVGVEAGGGSMGSFTVRLESVPLEADFVFAATGLTVAFTDTTTNDPTDWLWTFGDPQSSTSRQQNPTFTYGAAGTYQVTLKVTRGRSESQMTRSVPVSQ